ncbi:MAG TPA: SDR family NAD(P)-dependent oxidoreductase, partial [Candidatus Binatia bacterium]|nr:SDR family NAD(P)-dependent oxidoreductase [Candidatus Binatia bacterium]
MEYRGLVVVVTGASTGIGRATTLTLVRRGATVVGIARNAD